MPDKEAVRAYQMILRAVVSDDLIYRPLKKTVQVFGLTTVSG